MANIRGHQWSGLIEDLPATILDTRVRDFPISVIHKLGLMLYNDGRGEAGNWEGLAEELGVTTTEELEQIRRRALVEHIFPGCRLLYDWMGGEGKTVFVLLQALKAQCRQDCLEYLVQKCYGLHSMDLHVKIEFEAGRYEFMTVSTEMSASLASSLENILHSLPNYVITGPSVSIGWNTPARLLKGKQLSLKKVDATDATRHTVYGRAAHHVILPTSTCDPRSGQVMNRLDQDRSQHRLDHLKGPGSMSSDMTFNIPVSNQTVIDNTQPKELVLPSSVSYNNASGCKHIATELSSSACMECLTSHIKQTKSNDKNSLTEPEHEFVNGRTTIKYECSNSQTTSKSLYSDQSTSPQWPTLATLPNIDCPFGHVTPNTHEATVKGVEGHPRRDDTSLKHIVKKPPDEKVPSQNKMCIKEHFMTDTQVTGPMSVHQFLATNTTYAKSSVKPGQPLTSVSFSKSTDDSFPTSYDNRISRNIVDIRTTVPSSVAGLNPVLISQVTTATLSCTSARTGSTTATPSPAYIGLDHPAILATTRRCVPPSVEPLPSVNVTPGGSRGGVSRPQHGPVGNASSPVYYNLIQINTDKSNPRPCPYNIRPDGYVDLGADPPISDMEVSETGDKTSGYTDRSSECRIQKNSDGYFGFADISDIPEGQKASQSANSRDVVSHDLSILENGTLSMESESVEAASGLSKSVSAPVTICATSDGYFGFARNAESPKTSDHCLFAMEVSQSDSTLVHCDRDRLMDTEMQTRTTMQSSSPHQNKKVTWQLTYSTLANESDEEEEGYIDMNGPLSAVPGKEYTRQQADGGVVSAMHSVGSLDSETESHYGYTYIPLDEVPLVKPRAMSLPQLRPALPMKRARSDSSPLFGRRDPCGSAFSEIPGWCPDETESTIEGTMSKYKNEDGNFIVWFRAKTQKFVISVSHLGEIRHYVIHEVILDRQIHYYVFKSGKQTPDLMELITHYQREGLKGPDPNLTGYRGKKWQQFSHIKLKTPLSVRKVTTVVRKDKLSVQ